MGVIMNLRMQNERVKKQHRSEGCGWKDERVEMKEGEATRMDAKTRERNSDGQYLTKREQSFERRSWGPEDWGRRSCRKRRRLLRQGGDKERERNTTGKGRGGRAQQSKKIKKGRKKEEYVLGREFLIKQKQVCVCVCRIIFYLIFIINVLLNIIFERKKTILNNCSFSVDIFNLFSSCADTQPADLPSKTPSSFSPLIVFDFTVMHLHKSVS